MSLDGIAISGRGALAQAARIEALATRLAAFGNDAKNGQRVGIEDGQQVGFGQYGEVAGRARRAGLLDENRDGTLSGVRPVLDSVELIRALRALEANLQAIRIQDAVLERTVNELARPVR
ncbi:MAG TPA: hypothetical protein VE981_20425 [Planctomycetota bacterium]|nr:hypothetical protein [Planctomycetota bacterium]